MGEGLSEGVSFRGWRFWGINWFLPACGYGRGVGFSY